MSKKLIIILSVVFVLLLSGLIYGAWVLINWHQFDIKDATLEIPTYEVEVYDEVYLDDLVGKKTDENVLLSTDKLGKSFIEYTIDNIKYQIIVNVVDKEAPISMVGDKYYHLKGTNFTILDDTFCGDNFDKKPKCVVEGNIDTDKVGSYNAKYIATDKSGNKFEKNFIVEVVEKSKKEETRMPFEEVKEQVGNNKLLIDVSKWQKDIDWKTVKESGIDYVFIRLGTQKYSTKEMILDEYFEKNYIEAKENDIKVGVYFFTYAKTKEEVIDHANFIIENLKGKEIDLGVAYDWECWDIFNEMNISIHDLNEIKDEFMTIMKDNGYRPLLYSSKNYLERIWNVNTDVWLAHYTKETNYKGDKVMWQFAENATIPGIEIKTDVNVYYE